MRYLITLKPLEPYMFGGDQTFGALGDKEAGSYIAHSRKYPQQTALLGMLRKEIMTQAGVLTRKRKGEWVDKPRHAKAVELVGDTPFDMRARSLPDLGAIEMIGPIFLYKEGKAVIPKADIDSYPYEAGEDTRSGKLKGYHAKIDIYDNYIATDGSRKYKASEIFLPYEQTGNKKGAEENSLFKKIGYKLADGFLFAFHIDSSYPIESAMVALGADGSRFWMDVLEDTSSLEYTDANGYLTLMSDAYITVDIREHTRFAITREISHRNLISKKSIRQKYPFGKSETLYLYEKGSVFIEPDEILKENLNNKNLQKIGYNIYTQGEK